MSWLMPAIRRRGPQVMGRITALALVSASAAGASVSIAQIEAANNANRELLRWVRMRERVQRVFSPQPDFAERRRAERYELEQHVLDTLRAQGRDQEALDAEAALPIVMTQYEDDIRVMRLNFELHLRRTRTLDLVGGKMRDDIVDSRDVAEIATREGLSPLRRRSLDQTESRIYSSDRLVRLLEDELALVGSPDRNALKRAEWSLGIIPVQVFSAPGLSVQAAPEDPDRLSMNFCSGEVQWAVIVRPTLNFRVQEISRTKNGTLLQKWELPEYARQAEVLYPRQVRISTYHDGRQELVEHVMVDGFESLQSIEPALFEIPGSYRLDDLRSAGTPL